MKSMLLAVALAASLGVSLSACAGRASASPWGEATSGSAASARARAAGPASISVLPAPAPPTEQHAWLQQFVGNWTFTVEASAGEGAPPFVMHGTERVRSIGGLWIVGEGRASVGGQAMQSVLSLGYQPDTSSFVGTWLDTMQPHLWTYTGTLDPARGQLTLDTQGPSPDDPRRTSRYRDTIEFTDPDHRRLTSSVRDESGTWTTFMRAEYVRAR